MKIKLFKDENEVTFEGMRFVVGPYGIPLRYSATVYVGQWSHTISINHGSAEFAKRACEEFVNRWRVR